MVALTTRLDRTELKLGETGRATAVVKNRSRRRAADDAGPGLDPRRPLVPAVAVESAKELKLKEKGKLAFWETPARGAILYSRHLNPGEVKTVPVEFVATVPGS